MNALWTAVIILAGTMSGEAGVIGPIGELLVGEVFLERVAVYTGDGDPYEDVREVGFRGFNPDPPQQTIHLAMYLIDHYRPGDGYFFVISEQDRIMLGFPQGEYRVCSDDGRWMLHAYKKWPVKYERENEHSVHCARPHSFYHCGVRDPR